MMLGDWNNHYNIKFLKGCGHSVLVKNSKIILKDDHDHFSKLTREEGFVKNMPYEKMVLGGKGGVSAVALSLLSLNDRSVILQDIQDNPVIFIMV